MAGRWQEKHGVGLPSMLILAVGLAMDAMAVSAANGPAVPRLRPRHILLVALFFGGFQALMPLVGWLVGSRVGPFVEAWDHWIAFVLLCVIGGKMLWEARAPHGPAQEGDPFQLSRLALAAVATSIDALAVGVTLPLVGARLWMSLMVIGVTTALLSVVGLFAGRLFGAVLGQRFDAVGGVVLIAIGTKILVQHLWG